MGVILTQCQKAKSQLMVASPLWGLFLSASIVLPFSQLLLPRYGGYSRYFRSGWQFYRWLLPRYGGYSISIILEFNSVLVASPLWGLFLQYTTLSLNCFVASPLWGLFLSDLKILDSRPGCFPVMGVIPSKLPYPTRGAELLPRYGGYSKGPHLHMVVVPVASPLWGLFF